MMKNKTSRALRCESQKMWVVTLRNSRSFQSHRHIERIALDAPCERQNAQNSYNNFEFCDLLSCPMTCSSFFNKTESTVHLTTPANSYTHVVTTIAAAFAAVHDLAVCVGLKVA